MTFTVGTLSRCSGNEHVAVPITVGGQQRTLQVLFSEIRAGAPDSVEEARAAIVARLRSAILEAGASTWAQAKTAIEGQTYQV